MDKRKNLEENDNASIPKTCHFEKQALLNFRYERQLEECSLSNTA